MNTALYVGSVKELCGKCNKPKGKEEGCCKCGRPSKYLDKTKEQWEDLINEYFEECKDEDYAIIKTDGNKSTTWENKVRVRLPSKEGLALKLELFYETLDEWAEKHTEFSLALRKIEKLQKERLINKGLSGDYSPVIAKLLLSANHGMAEKTENQNTEKVLISLK